MTQNQCVLHVGVPKAGSTSIQLSLFYRLRDPGFRYLSFGNIHSNVGLRLVFEADEEADQVMDLNKFEFYGISSNKLEMLRARYREKLLRAVADAQRKERTLILSSEAAWRFNSKRFEKIRDFFHAEGMQPTIVVYCRSPGDWLSSWYQQSIKMGYSDLDDILERLERVDFLAYEKKIRMFDQVFGAENVRTHLFDPTDFPGRCVVRHFCHEQGIEISPQTIIRDNDSVSLDATRMFFSWYRFVDPSLSGKLNRVRHTMLVSRLSRLSGSAMRLSRNMIAQQLDDFERQRPWIEQRIGTTLEPYLREPSEDSLIDQESDLLDFSTESLDWLCRQAKTSMIRPGSKEQVARQVAERVDRLFRQLDAKAFSAWASSEFGKRRRRLLDPLC